MLQGIIKNLDADKQSGTVVVKDKSYVFTFSDAEASTVKSLLIGMLVDFEALGDRAINIKPAPLSSYDENTAFGVPKQIGLSRFGVPEGFMLIDRSEFCLKVIERSELRAKQALAAYCKKFGANVVLEFSVKRIIKNSIGFSYYLYEAQGVPAVMGFPSSQSVVYLDELETMLNHQGIQEVHEKAKGAKLGIKIMKISGAFLLLIFILGFVASFF